MTQRINESQSYLIKIIEHGINDNFLPSARLKYYILLINMINRVFQTLHMKALNALSFFLFRTFKQYMYINCAKLLDNS